MLLNAVIIILREVMEASLIISLFLAFSQRHRINRFWLVSALPVGLISAIIYAMSIVTVSQWFDGVGQEIVNATIHSLIYLMLLLLVVLSFQTEMQSYKKVMRCLMFIGVVLASIREGSEIILYIHGFISRPELLKPVLFGGAIGAGIGVSIGVFFYYLLVNISKRAGITLGILLCLLVAGGMVLQATQLLSQADWLPSQYPLWDTSYWVSESSMIGQLLYALVGYEATPTAIQVISYITAVSSICILAYFSRLSTLRHKK